MKIALLGNPNTGKSSIFNLLTGMRQHVGNFPGVTVDKKEGTVKIKGETYSIIDFPGTYSVYPRSKDEQVVYDVVSNPSHEEYPAVALVVADATNIERNLFLFSQLYDLNIPCVLALNMRDLAKTKGIGINIEALQIAFPAASIVETNARVGFGKERLLNALQTADRTSKHAPFLPNARLAAVDDFKAQEEEAANRFELIQQLVQKIKIETVKKKQSFDTKLDRILVHPIFGYLIFAAILLIVFQFIFAVATIPMDLIDGSFSTFSSYIASLMPKGILSDLIAQGIIPGIGGVVVFVPQIALLFFFIALLEESGYLARVVFIMDRIMRPLGLNGKSVVPLLSSVACAIPGVMATRTISDWKERLTTILVAPLMSCSARIPVYTLLIALVIPNKTLFHFFNLQGLVLFGLYALGLIAALFIAFILKHTIKTKEKGYLLLELPSFKPPQWKNVGLVVWEKLRVFVTDAGKVILAISIILWAMATFGPSERMQLAEKQARISAQKQALSSEETAQKVAAVRLENSYIGLLGKTIEPVIQPLGYDWKIGISLITSFAAREVFVGSLATIYAVQDDGGENKRLIDRLREDKRADGRPTYTLASGVSLMIFYVFAMQCMATLAVVKRETKSWKWPLIQIGFMAALAYIGAWIAYTLLA
ncbi:MAG: ferrous iron transport protein B [Crocinitomicaceae bacterium]|nr:ferrous iron transport protein B [Crocinitomicaceae bacterium]